MGWISKLLGNKPDEDAPLVVPSVDSPELRKRLSELEHALTELYRGMNEDACPLSNPGWQGKLKDYAWVRGEVAEMLESKLTHDRLYDLLLSVRPVFPRDVPIELDFIGPLQQRVMDAAGALREALG